ncbi:hypothetical protein [Methylobacter sp. YRD-M1]|uniref:hypothetical protein n=1 Tax=Methylobacter sp. YRD-M1 TaxID=2911520 RepID=UPI00227CEA44|nr:hypothetical protein [Methylobacter sp. YRD-M1]WAK01571.1 hypothetical protein LZ558_17335 [Methylobacter sp. YRD-M1]
MISSKHFLSFFILCLGMALGSAALPRFKAALNHIPVETGIDKIARHRPLTEAEASRLIETSKKSIALFDHPDYWQNLSELFYYQAQKQGFYSDAGQALLKQSADSARRSLHRSPANSQLWYKLATIDVLLHEQPDKIQKELLMSIRTGPHETAVLTPRLRLCLSVLPAFSQDDRDVLSSQLVDAWNLSHKRFIKAFDSTLYMDTISALLTNSHPLVLKEMVAEFETTH